MKQSAFTATGLQLDGDDDDDDDVAKAVFGSSRRVASERMRRIYDERDGYGWRHWSGSDCDYAMRLGRPRLSQRPTGQAQRQR